MLSNSFIYVLIDPRDNRVRYVGKSSVGLKRTTQLHSAKCGSWQKSLKKSGLQPIVEVVEYCDDLNEAEVRWISFYRSLHSDILNMTLGGDGLPKGWKMSDETRKRMSEGHRGKKQSLEHVANRSAALKGRVSVWKGKKIPEEVKVKMSLARKAYWERKKVID